MQRLIFQSSGPDSSHSRHAVCKLTLGLSLVLWIRCLVDLTAPTLSAGDAIIKLHPALEKGVASLYCIGIMVLHPWPSPSQGAGHVRLNPIAS